MYNINASLYAQAKQFHYAKVEVDGVFISGIKVSYSTKYPNEPWIQMPAYKKGKEWKRYIEIANDSKLGQAIYDAIKEVAMPVIMGESPRSKPPDVVLEDIDDGPIDMSQIPF